MKKREAKKYEKLLLEKLAHLRESIGNIEKDTLYESSQDSSGDLSSFAESGTDNFERETALHIASGESQRLRADPHGPAWSLHPDEGESA